MFVLKEKTQNHALYKAVHSLESKHEQGFHLHVFSHQYII